MELGLAFWVPIVINAIVVAVGYGALRQEVKHQKERMDKLEKGQCEDHDTANQSRADIYNLTERVNSNHKVLPECLGYFKETRDDIKALNSSVGEANTHLAEISGQVKLLTPKQ